MKLQRVIEILIDFQNWRRSEPPYDDPATKMKYSAEEVGKAIDFAINKLKTNNY